MVKVRVTGQPEEVERFAQLLRQEHAARILRESNDLRNRNPPLVRRYFDLDVSEASLKK